MEIGERAELERSFTQGDLEAYAALGGGPSDGAVPEPLIGALFSYLLGVKLPGPGTNYLKQEIAFHRPAPLDTPLTASVEVTRIREEKAIVDLWSKACLPDGTVVAEGRSLVKFADTGHA
ncbi:hotdog family protein [Histidinibacterium aquaticum]|uniref:Phosphate acetyltransferase n=1 Tax=Histidinibacterium aquaticum TaxID=2613962 RepID=A0A5J5GI98_9RHOB|nr:phosphate acetyltransferase [Histidinibacterium aquaticum]KAA9007885.1 phosphate acetyltransferase [Histidinibacterium aquaticum]